jgi:hypothetical protein
MDPIFRAGDLESGPAFLSDLERIEAGAHEFAEIGLLNALLARSVVLPEDVRVEAERLLGGAGADLHSRVGLGPDAPPEEVEARLKESLVRWQLQAENPLASSDAVTAARVLVRTSEGLFAASAAVHQVP